MRLPADKVHTLRGFFEGRHCAITGGAGFIGSHLLDALHALGARVTVIDDLFSSDGAHLAEMIELDPERVRFVHGSILDDPALFDAFEDASVVFHLAAICSVPRSLEAPRRTWEVNATGTLAVLAAARRAGAARTLIAASSSAYGDTHELPKVETTPPAPRSPYAASKLAAEALASAFAHAYDHSAACLRFFNIFGPRQSAEGPYAGVIPAFATRINQGLPPRIEGDGEQTRDFTYVANAVLAMLLAASTPNDLRGDVLNVGVGERISINRLAETMLELMEAPHLTPEHTPQRPGDVRHSLASIDAARDRIAYEPVTHFREGLAETVAFYRNDPARETS